MGDVKILLVAVRWMHEGRENGRVEEGESEEGRKDRGLHKGGSGGTEGHGQPGEVFPYRM